MREEQFKEMARLQAEGLRNAGISYSGCGQVSCKNYLNEGLAQSEYQAWLNSKSVEHMTGVRLRGDVQ